MTCKKCGKTIDENSKACEFCGEKVGSENIPCQPQGFDTQNQQYSPPVVPQPPQPPQPPFQQENQYAPYAPYAPYPNMPVSDDKKNIGFNFLGFFIPLVGIIMYFVDRDKYPIRSKSLIHCSIAGMITSVVTVLLSVLLSMLILFSFGSAQDEINNSDDNSIIIEQTTETIEKSENERSEKSSEKATTKKGTSDFVPKEIGKNWSEMAIEVNGQKISLPCTYKEFAEKTGFTLSEKDAKRELAGIDDTKEIVSSNGVMFDIFLQNMVDVPKNYEDCFVNGIYLESHDNVENIVISPKIYLNQNLSEALKLLGSPYETFTSPDISFCTYTYTFGECPTARMLEIVSYDGVKIAAITLKYI